MHLFTFFHYHYLFTIIYDYYYDLLLLFTSDLTPRRPILLIPFTYLFIHLFFIYLSICFNTYPSTYLFTYSSFIHFFIHRRRWPPLKTRGSAPHSLASSFRPRGFLPRNSKAIFPSRYARPILNLGRFVAEEMQWYLNIQVTVALWAGIP